MIIKFCGIKTIAEAQAARDEGADLIGFVFADSRRRIEVSEAKDISRNVKGIGKVGVFVNEDISTVLEIAKECKLDFIQLHGSESAEYCQSVAYPVIKALRAESLAVKQLSEYKVSYILLDSAVNGQFGGTGLPFDWQQVKEVRQKIKTPVIIAGGLNAVNVGDAITVLKPEGIDVSGGIETKGRKDIAKMAEFIKAAKLRSSDNA